VNSDETISTLARHLEHLNRNGRNQTLYFEGSEICCRSPFFSCRSSRCVLIPLVPDQYRSQAAPCRHIVLNGRGDTLEQLYGSGSKEYTKTAVQNWLFSTIRTLESDRAKPGINAEAA
jgi:hypothetical protein